MYPLTTTANYIVGDFGTLLKLNSGSWVQITGLPDSQFYGIGGSFPESQNRMTIVGTDGTIVLLKMPLQTGHRETNINSNILYAVTSASTASPFAIRRIAVGAGGIILKSDFSLPNSWACLDYSHKQYNSGFAFGFLLGFKWMDLRKCRYICFALLMWCNLEFCITRNI